MSLEQILSYMDAEDRFLTTSNTELDYRIIQEFLDSNPEAKYTVTEIANHLMLPLIRVIIVIKSEKLHFIVEEKHHKNFYSSKEMTMIDENLRSARYSPTPGFPIKSKPPDPLGYGARSEFFERCAYRPKKGGRIVIRKF